MAILGLPPVVLLIIAVEIAERFA
jgi:proton-dependent oligopeptide transporter, POT family